MLLTVVACLQDRDAAPSAAPEPAPAPEPASAAAEAPAVAAIPACGRHPRIHHRNDRPRGLQVRLPTAVCRRCFVVFD